MTPLPGIVLGLLLIPLGVAGCSFCVGSGCTSSGIDFGTSYKQASGGGDISIQGKKSTFSVGEPVAMVAHLSDNAGTKTLTLRVTGGAKTLNLSYPVSSASDNVLASTFSGTDLTSMGLNAPGHYTLILLHGSTNLAQGTLTEK